MFIVCRIQFLHTRSYGSGFVLDAEVYRFLFFHGNSFHFSINHTLKRFTFLFEVLWFKILHNDYDHFYIRKGKWIYLDKPLNDECDDYELINQELLGHAK